ncbi:MAG: 5-formyltetrahydrofolate cyclo-ligase [Holophagaceae bacterium]|nr:5-formyltetrahydrofolate cyclo-ligase [Holophagaceae bacterium]
MDSKPELRKRMSVVRDGLPAEARAAASAALCARIEAFCVSRRIRKVGAFWPLGSEVDLRPLIQGHPDWLFWFPRVASTAPPRLAWGTEPLQPGLWGLMEPTITQHFTPPVDLLLVPGLAFDDRGFRVGYGKGYYDTVLERLGEEVITMGACFQAQLVDHVPEEMHDQPVDWLATESRIRDLR